MQQSKWLAVYTRYNREKQVAESLLKKGIQSFCPYNNVHVRSNGRGKVVCEPLFRSRVFVHLTEDKEPIVLQTRGVINFLYWHGERAVIKNEEITAINEFLGEYQHIELEKMPVSITQDVQLITSPLLKRNGNVLEVLNSTVKVLLPSLGYVLVANARKENAGAIIYREDYKISV